MSLQETTYNPTGYFDAYSATSTYKWTEYSGSIGVNYFQTTESWLQTCSTSIFYKVWLYRVCEPGVRLISHSVILW